MIQKKPSLSITGKLEDNWIVKGLFLNKLTKKEGLILQQPIKFESTDHRSLVTQLYEMETKLSENTGNFEINRNELTFQESSFKLHFEI